MRKNVWRELVRICRRGWNWEQSPVSSGEFGGGGGRICRRAGTGNRRLFPPGKMIYCNKLIIKIIGEKFKII
jgi:hypothetical protein